MEGFISKKDLLEKTGISYGQLYRWKRKNLIPEAWFTRKTTYTGQETYFPEEKIIERIEKIKRLKDDLSLDDLARFFSPSLDERKFSKAFIIEYNIVSKETIDQYMNDEEITNDSIDQMLSLYMIEKALQSGEVSKEEAILFFEMIQMHAHQFHQMNCELYLIRKKGVFTCFLVSSDSVLFFDRDTKVLLCLNALKCMEELKVKIHEAEAKS
ncbi:DUF4004 family protein [Hazenella sp. IB182357]|uniref:DUF4004 family protein n=1 Tax=Polycladospora coralii TaxID=2771432 RepID=A0A926N7I7_9BACL|nr:DUF4004 family protein [Polycladospora coralii]MBD1371451.1 DUF4004 family protein [Polycladospora coralii]MBS7530419.1 DUF4004 family protein [Polycladospora coralii]